MAAKESGRAAPEDSHITIPSKLVQVAVADLKERAFSTSIYPPDPTSDLIESIHKNGVLKPPIADRNLVLVDGHTRVRACRILGIQELLVEVLDTDDLAILEPLVLEHNRYRKKGWRIHLKEAAELEKHLRAEAKNRQRTGGRALLNCAKGRLDVRARLAKFLGISGEVLRRVRQIAELRPDLLDEIDSGSESVNSAFHRLAKEIPSILPRRSTSKPDHLRLDHNRAARALGYALAQQLRFPFPVTGPAFACMLDGLRAGLTGSEPKVPPAECWPSVVALCPLLSQAAIPQSPTPPAPAHQAEPAGTLAPVPAQDLPAFAEVPAAQREVLDDDPDV